MRFPGSMMDSHKRAVHFRPPDPGRVSGRQSVERRPDGRLARHGLPADSYDPITCDGLGVSSSVRGVRVWCQRTDPRGPGHCRDPTVAVSCYPAFMLETKWSILELGLGRYYATQNSRPPADSNSPVVLVAATATSRSITRRWGNKKKKSAEQCHGNSGQ